MRQLPEMNCQYGAPMGRRTFPTKPSTKTVRLFRVKLDRGGYDDGGAYWGLPMWNLWCAMDTEGDYFDFVRANSRTEAASLLGIESLLMRANRVEA
jgi:hypothetical protein